MSMPTDPRFHAISSALAPPEWSRRGGKHQREHQRELQPAAEASVAVVLRARAQLELLLVRRAVSTADPWSGHMALPGGRRSSGDDSAVATAIRETQEETGVLLLDTETLGELAPVSPQSLKVPTLRVSPFVFGVGATTEASVASPEIDEVFWIPLPELRDPRNHRPVEIPLIGTLREFPAYLIADQVVWGMTYRILNRFLADAPDSLP